MKVYNFDDTMWIAAKDENEAKIFAKEEFGWNELETEEAFQGEASLDKTMLIHPVDLPEEELRMAQEMELISESFYARRSFKWVIENNDIKEPCVIASTEW
ncbi:hypothetical protein [Virgibacillus proomii]|uniref:hypothetical protein n=1 Tax=Virgibacillus proomii TaxID=84407 RepID=UPI000985044A|nr:hypothetical protein [Virgibacillus proomii]